MQSSAYESIGSPVISWNNCSKGIIRKIIREIQKGFSRIRPKIPLKQSSLRTPVIPRGGMSPTSEIMEAITPATSGAA